MESSGLKITDLIRRGKRIKILRIVKCARSHGYIRVPSPPDHEKVLSLTAGAVLLHLVDAVEDGKKISSILLVCCEALYCAVVLCWHRE